MKTAEELARSNLDLEQFAYVASHDLQEPLRAVAGCVQILQKRYQGQLDDRADELIAHTVDGVSRMQTLIDDLLSYSRVGTRGKAFEPTDCNAVLQQALANLRSRHRRIGGGRHPRSPARWCKADAAQLTQLFQNLIGNAIKFRGEQPPRSTSPSGARHGQWLFSVQDNGIGMRAGVFRAHLRHLPAAAHPRPNIPAPASAWRFARRSSNATAAASSSSPKPGQGSTFSFTSLTERGIP